MLLGRNSFFGQSFLARNLLFFLSIIIFFFNVNLEKIFFETGMHIVRARYYILVALRSRIYEQDDNFFGFGVKI